MFSKFRSDQFQKYTQALGFFQEHTAILTDLEKFFTEMTCEFIRGNYDALKHDYNEASYLNPFWQNYPPDDRGRAPKGDQIPWIEVGEHAIGDRILCLFSQSTDFKIRHVGFPTGSDLRFVLKGDKIKEITQGLTDSVWIFIDIKSVGPRDDKGHVVMSPNQISGNGKWKIQENGVLNDSIVAQGKHTSHDFHCCIPPVFVLSDLTIVPVILLAIKPVYSMVSLDGGVSEFKTGQPLKKIEVISIPNGLLLSDYLEQEQFRGLFFPGKDDKSKNPLKLRSRIDFSKLKIINDWRVQELL